jgi:hypothetical protein
MCRSSLIRRNVSRDQRSWWVLCLVALAMFSCRDTGKDNGGGDGGVDGGCEDLGCACVTADDCTGALECIESFCQPEGCESGLEGCACTLGDKCARDTAGNPLQCISAMCLPLHCSGAGVSGCPCINGVECITAGESCRDGVCMTENCIPGEENCACLGGGCDPELLCRDDTVCISNQGYEGGACLENETCYRGNRCSTDLNTCVHCELGSEGCHCNDADACQEGSICLAGRCLGIMSVPPENPVCYYPCEEDLIVDGDLISACDSDGLLSGCLTDQDCVSGNCLAEGAERPTCAEDAECPFFQVCLQGHCYANCTSSDDCITGMACHQKACRIPCQTNLGSAACPKDYSCATVDGENGHCMPLAGRNLKAVSGLTTLPSGGMTLEPSTFLFSNIDTTDSFKIVPIGNRSQTFTVRKVSHILYDENGNPDIVDVPRDAETHEYVTDFECDAAKGECPLSWLSLAFDGSPTQAASIEVVATAGCDSNCPVITLGNAGAAPGVRWTGVLEVATLDGRARDYITLSYVQRPEGHWAGSMFYFANFSDNGLDTWELRADKSNVSGVDNGLIQRWGALRAGSLDAWGEFKAVLTSTRTESWKYGRVKEKCADINGNNDAACYPFSNAAGVRTYVANKDESTVPSGLSEMPMAVNLMIDTASGQTELKGRIESRVAMHYAGNPAITLSFAADPQLPDSCADEIASDCIVYLADMETAISVGGRYLTSFGGSCATGYVKKKLPWLVPGFEDNTHVEALGPYQYHCIDTEVPYDTTADDALVPSNVSLTWGNPVSDGRPVNRTLRLLDGALVNQSQLFILFEESFDTLTRAGGEPVSAYGYMILTRQPADLDNTDADKDGVPDVFAGSTPPETLQKTIPVPTGLTCNIDFVKEVMGASADSATDLGDVDVDDLVETMIEGIKPGAAPPALESDRTDANVVVNYYCHDTGMFNAGPNDYPGASGPRYPCPAGSKVTFFEVVDSAGPVYSQEDIANFSCQEETEISCFNYGCPTCAEIGCDDGDGSDDEYETACKTRTGCDTQDCEPQIDCVADNDGACLDLLNQWKESDLTVEDYELTWKCEDAKLVYCDEFEVADSDGTPVDGFGQRLDLRAGKLFFPPTGPSDEKVMRRLQTAIDDAFRYKTRFVSRSGSVLGFAPLECIPNSDEIRYCYDPPAIEEIIKRVDCLMAVYTDPSYYGLLDDAESDPAPELWTKDKLDAFLRGSYAEFALRRDGFERLHSELLVMLGDEALTSAFASRFDLAGINTRSFEGTEFEGTDGINLSGVAGAEMFNLHQAVQYYQMALDRLYRAGPNFQAALAQESTDSPNNFISAETVTLYLERLIRASTQKIRAYSQVAKSYQNFNQPDLSRRVITRAYTAAYLESAVIKELMNDIAAKSIKADQPQIYKIVEDAQRRYRMGMLDMRDIFLSITDDVNYFGFAPDYIPFPAIDTNKTASTNGFEVMLGIAKQKTFFAKQREDYALQSNRNVNTDAETFQAELVRIRNTYESQLGDICGTFKASYALDGEEVERVYPAIRKYASLDDNASLWGDPCGRMGNGAIYNAIVAQEQSQLQDRMIKTRLDNKMAAIENERSLVAAQCGLTMDQAKYTYERQGEIIEIQTGLGAARVALDAFVGYTELAGSVGKAIKWTALAADPLNASTNAGNAADHTVDAITTGITTTAQLAYGTAETELTRQMEEKNRDTAKWVSEKPCEAAIINSNARTADMLLALREIQLEMLQAIRDSSQKFSEIGRQYNTAQRMQDEQADAEQMLINVQAARNDPNVRIYRNDAIINADIAFNDALRAAYRSTKLFEYYTSQSHARLEQLFLIRMVAAGDYNLENYLLDLENEFFDWEEIYGLPDVRVAMLSLRDDILAIPTVDRNNQPLSNNDRIQMMRDQLGSIELIDSNGYLSVPFSTKLERLSPLTRNHKIYYIEADIIGSNVGDTIGRLYLRQSGTGVVHTVQNELDFYIFPERTAVLNPFFNGNRVFTPEVYRSNRLRDRPMVNTGWEIMVNQRDETVNKDIDLQSLSDIRVYVYYTDFTVF